MDEGNAFRRSQAIPVGRVRKRSERIMKKYAFSKFTNDPSNPVLIDVDVSSSVSKRSESVPKKKPTSEPISIQISSDYAVKSSAPGKRGQNPIKKDEVAKKFVNLETPSVSVSTAKHKHVSQQSSIPVSVPSKFGRRLHPHLSRTKKPTLTMETRSSVPDKKKHASQIKAKSSAPQSDSDFEAPAPVMQPKKRKAGPVSKAQKKRKYVKKQIHAENSSKDFILFRTSPQILFHTLHSLSKAQRDYVISIGLGPLLNMTVDGIPTSIGYYAVKNFDVDKMVLNVNRGQLPVNREVVHQLLGLPLGTIDLYTMPFTPEGDTTFHDFDAQFANEKDIRPKAVQRAILRSREVDSMFKVNLFVLICNTLGQSMSMGTCDLAVLTKAHKNLDLTNFDWCTFVIRCLKNTVPAWNPNTKNGYFYGPITLLSLLYLEGIRFDAIHLDRGLPAICYWNSATMKVREEMEQKTIGFGMGELQIPFTPVSESDPDENSDIQNIEHFTSSIGLKYSKILDLKHIVEAELADGLSKFPGAFRILSLATKLNQLFHEGCPKSDCTCRADASPEDVPLSQWWTDPDNLNAVEMSMVLASSGSKNFQNSPIATRAFGLSAEFESVLHHNPHAHIPSPIPLSVYDNREEAHGDDQKLKRHVNKPLASRSPFAQRTVDINKSISSKETIISEWLFSITDDPNEIVFDTAEGVTAQRYHLESLFKRCEVFAHVIDIWSYLLNLLEEIRGPHSPSRFFCNTTVTSLYLENEIMPLNERKQLFMSNILHCIADADTTLRSFHLVFLPVVRNAHIYLFVLDLKTPDFVIVDNMKVVESNSVAYGLLPNLVTNCFADYMRSVNHPMSEAFSRVVPRILDMSWRTTDNHTDCGIFTMRHMETYMGPSQRDFKSGFKNESRQQQLQLDKLRMKYAYAILTSNSNKLKKTVELRAAEFNKVDPDERKLLREAASQNIKSRLRRFG